jgi:hypothetical protein
MTERECRIFSLWIDEELAELKKATSLLSQLDALLDMAGLIGAALTPFEGTTVRTALLLYHESQRQRNRPELPHRRAVDAMVDRIASACISWLPATFSDMLEWKARQRGWS